MRTYFIRTFGCQMNLADSEVMAGILEARGMSRVTSMEAADLLVVNTCTIRRKAEDKGVSELGRCLVQKRRRGALVAAVGCVTRQRGAALLESLPGLDILLGPRRVGRLGEALDERLAHGRPVLDLGDETHTAVLTRPAREGRVTTGLTIMQGCDNRCAYCVVPGVRGAEAGRPAEDILREAAGLADAGYREVTLLGQNVNSWGKDLPGRPSFPDLLELLDRRSGLARIRFTTSHPRGFDRRMAEAVRDLPSVCEWVHLPVQAGSDRVLAAMSRGYTAGEYRDKVALLRDVVPEVSLSSDVIVGFPGESEHDFLATLDLIGETGFAALFAFKFSPREGTPAGQLRDDVPREEKDRRLQAVLRLQAARTVAYHRGWVGRTAEVLAEGPAPRGAGMVTGRTRTNIPVHFPGPVAAGDLVGVPILEARPHCLIGGAAASWPRP